MKVIEIGGKKYLAVLASKEEKYGTVRFYAPAENFTETGRFSFPSTFDAGDGNISDFDTIKISADTDLFVAGGKTLGNGGRIYCSTVKNKTLSSPETCRFQPESPEGGFGNSVFNNKNGEIVVGMPEYIHRL